MIEQVFRYGETGQGFGITTLPEVTDGAPVLILLNSGLLHREEPYRLNVHVCRALSKLGYICIRVDLAGKGDTPERLGLSNRASVALDWSFIHQSIEKQFGKRVLLLLGLCSGADNAIKLAAVEPLIKGLVLLDPVSLKDKNFKRRQLLQKMRNRHAWLRLFQRLVTLRFLRSRDKSATNESISLRDPPSDDEIKKCFQALIERQGKALTIFTSYAMKYYNERGQFVRSLDLGDLDTSCTEVFWPHVGHIFPAQHHREKLLNTISKWAEENFKHLT